MAYAGSWRILPVLVGAVAVIAGPAAAQTATASRPELLTRLVGCRAVSDSAARLACYDQTTEALDAAERQGQVVVVDRAQVTAARRQLFGFQLPSITLFDQGEAAEPINQIETTLTRAVMVGEGRWLFTLADGTAWRQIDSESVNFRNRAGEAVRVRKATLGSYLLTTGGSRAVRVRRQ